VVKGLGVSGLKVAAVRAANIGTGREVQGNV
jgi:hypothetical protein